MKLDIRFRGRSSDPHTVSDHGTQTMSTVITSTAGESYEIVERGGRIQIRGEGRVLALIPLYANTVTLRVLDE